MHLGTAKSVNLGENFSRPVETLKPNRSVFIETRVDIVGRFVKVSLAGTRPGFPNHASS